MARLVWKNGNQGFYNLRDLHHYDRVLTTAGKIVLRYDGDDGAYDPTRHAWRVEVLTSGRTTFRPEDGPDAGQAIVTAGTITGLRYFNKAGRLILEVTDVGGDLASFEHMMRRDNGQAAYDAIMAGDNTYIGARNGGGADWDGDDITSGFGNDTITAGAGDDYIKDYGGRDVYRGGSGFDTVSYDQWFWNPQHMKSGIVANLATGQVRGPDGLTDTLFSIESLRGTQLTDRMTGNAQDNFFVGLGGRDIFDGGAGMDAVSFHRDYDHGGRAGARVNLAKGFARDGYGTTDKLTSIEGARGTEQRDIFTDNGRSNWFRGDGGNDLFNLSRGDDTVRGGDGADRFVFRGTAIGNDVIEDFNPGEGDRIRIVAVDSFADLTITQEGGDAIVAGAGGRIRLSGWDADDVTAGAFLF